MGFNSAFKVLTCISQCHFLYGRCNIYTATFHIYGHNSDNTIKKRHRRLKLNNLISNTSLCYEMYAMLINKKLA